MPSPPHLRARLSGPTTLAVAVLLTASAALSASAALAQGLPATQPTSLPAPIAATSSAATSSAKSAAPANRAEVTYADGLLNVRANNSSLHQVLRSISKATGMTITGGIGDERVFGNYGPAAPATVLATLLDGTGTNILLRDGDDTRPMQLILTPRTGGITPPMAATPIAMEADEAAPRSFSQPFAQPATQPATQPASGSPLPGEDPRAAARRLGPPGPNNNPIQPAASQTPTQPNSTPASIPQPINNVNGSPANSTPSASEIPTTDSMPIDSVPTPSTTPPATQGIVDTPNPPSPTSTTGSGAKTPEQIYQQLLQMQKQQQQQNAPAQPTTPPPAGPSS